MEESLVTALDNGTILVVDDVAEITELVALALRIAHYRVLTADGPLSAMRIATQERDALRPIDLMLSDIEMPNRSGPELGDAVKMLFPKIRLMFMSGNPNGSMLILNYGWAFIEKPCVIDKLLAMVRNVMETPNKSQGGHQYDTRSDLKRFF